MFFTDTITDMADLSIEYLGLNLRNPIIVGSSGLTEKTETIRNLEQNGAAAVVLKSLFEEEIILEKQASLRQMGSGGTLYPETLDLYQYEDVPKENTAEYLDLIRNVKKQVSIPVLATMIKKLSEAKIKGLVLFNRFYSPDIDLDNFEITSGSVLSSPGDISLSLRWIAIMAERVDCDLAASTGIHDGSAVIKQLLAGANAVQIVSAIYKHGGEKIGEMLHDMKSWMAKHGFNSIDDFRGKLSQGKSDNPAAFERVQFMKYFRGYTG